MFGHTGLHGAHDDTFRIAEDGPYPYIMLLPAVHLNLYGYRCPGGGNLGGGDIHPVASDVCGILHLQIYITEQTASRVPA